MIPEHLVSRKEWLQPLTIAAIVVLVGLTAFGLGRLSAFDEMRRPVVLHGAVVGGVEQPVATSSAL